MPFHIITGLPDAPVAVQAETASDALLLAQTSLDEGDAFEIKSSEGQVLSIESLEAIAASEVED